MIFPPLLGLAGLHNREGLCSGSRTAPTFGKAAGASHSFQLLTRELLWKTTTRAKDWVRLRRIICLKAAQVNIENCQKEVPKAQKYFVTVFALLCGGRCLLMLP